MLHSDKSKGMAKEPPIDQENLEMPVSVEPTRDFGVCTHQDDVDHKRIALTDGITTIPVLVSSIANLLHVVDDVCPVDAGATVPGR